MKIYPSRQSSLPIWNKYMYPGFIQAFDFWNISFVGYNAPNDGINDSQLTLLTNELRQHTQPFKILYSHYDYNNKIANNLPSLGIDTYIYGHEHIPGIKWDDHTLWVKTDNAYEPTKAFPGYRMFYMNQSKQISIDGKEYNFIFKCIILFYGKHPLKTYCYAIKPNMSFA